jgi:HK97 family phage major capsid protein
MKKLKLTGVLMMAAMALAMLPFVAFGVGVEAAVYSVAVLGCVAMFVEKDNAYRPAKSLQAGEVGESLKKVEAEYKQVSADLKKVGDELKTFAESSQKELKNHSALSEQTKASVDKLLNEQGGLQARLQAAEQKLVSMEDGDRNQPNRVLSLGEHVVNSQGFKDVDWGAQSRLSIGIQAAITSLDDSAGSLIVPQRVPGIIAAPMRRMTIRDLIAPGRTSSNSVEYVRETGFTNNASVVSENPTNDKPESDIEFELDQAKVATIAHLVRASKQILDDAAGLASFIDGRLRYGLQLKEELQLLKGSGVGLNINGIYTQATAYANPGVTVQAQTRIDQLRLALLQAELAEYYADGIVLNPIDWAAIELLKSSTNEYLLSNPFVMSPAGLWSRPVVATQSMTAAEFLVGAFQMGAQLYDREDANVVISTEDKDNFSKNMITIRGEERLALTVYRPEAFVKGEFEEPSA